MTSIERFFSVCLVTPLCCAWPEQHIWCLWFRNTWCLCGFIFGAGKGTDRSLDLLIRWICGKKTSTITHLHDMFLPWRDTGTSNKMIGLHFTPKMNILDHANA